MNKKLTFTVIVLAGLMFGAGATTIADNVWQGHQNIVETKNNIDKLTAKINASKSSLSDLQHQLSDVRTHAGSKAMIAVMLLISGASIWVWANWRRGK